MIMYRFRRLFIVLFLCVACMAFANSQKYYPVSSSEWQAVNDICHYAGVAGPTSFGPVPAEELLVALDRAEKRLGNNDLIDQIKDVIQDDGALIGYQDDFGFINLKGRLSPEMYVQTNTTTCDGNEYSDGFWLIRDYRSREPMLSISIETGVKDSVYGKFVMNGKQKQYSSGTWDKAFSTNITGNMTSCFPFEAGVSLGGRGFNFIVARDKVSLGEGKTGNTAIGDVFDYQEFFRAGYHTRVFATHLNLTYFDSSRGQSSPFEVNSSSFSGWKQIRHSVDYELVVVDRVKIGLAFITLLDTDSGFDVRLLNPFMVMHGMFNFHEDRILEANNMMYLDVSYSFAPRWNVYLQITTDQIQIPGEASHYEEEFGYTDPNAFGGLVNVSYTDNVFSGLLTSYVEAVLNMPGMYLNQKYYTDSTCSKVQQKKSDYKCWSQDFLVGYSRYGEAAEDMAFSGYTYGPDCIVVALGADYSELGKCSVSGRLQYMAHGEKGRGSDYSNYDFSGIDSETTMNRMPLEGEEVEHTVSFTLEGEYSVLDWLSFYAGAGFAYRINENFSGKNGFNVQFALGATVALN